MRAVLGFLVGRPLGVLIGTLYFLWLTLLNVGKRRQRIKIATWCLGARGLRVSAITFGHRVFCRTTTPWTDLVEHEHVHVRQYERYGWVGFLQRYGEQVVRYGYMAAPFEVAARGWRDA